MTYNPQEYWNKRSVDYKAQRHTKDAMHLIETVKMLQPERILEVGPGTGEMAKILFDAELIDPLNYKMADITKGFRTECIKNTGISPMVYKDKIPFPENWFDLVISFSVLLHVPPDKLVETLQDYGRVSSKHIFIATYEAPQDIENLSGHCFNHDYLRAFRDANLSLQGTYSGEHHRSCYILGTEL